MAPPQRRNSYTYPDTMHSRRPSVALSIPYTFMSHRSSADFFKKSPVLIKVNNMSQNDAQGFRPSITSTMKTDTSILGKGSKQPIASPTKPQLISQ
jgi:hypothetical protein